MGFFSKLLKSTPPSAGDAPQAPDAPSAEAAPPRSPSEVPASPEPAPLFTPVVMPALVPPAARPTPTDVYDRPTVHRLEPVVLEDRPTVVAPEPTMAALLAKTAPAPTSKPSPPRPRVPVARAEPPPLPKARLLASPPQPSVPLDPTRARERAELATLVDRLRRQNDDFEEASAGWTTDALQRKRETLLVRGQTLLAIEQHLTRLGANTLLRELERLPFVRKVQALSAFLAEAER